MLYSIEKCNFLLTFRYLYFLQTNGLFWKWKNVYRNVFSICSKSNYYIVYFGKQKVTQLLQIYWNCLHFCMDWFSFFRRGKRRLQQHKVCIVCSDEDDILECWQMINGVRKSQKSFIVQSSVVGTWRRGKKKLSLNVFTYPIFCLVKNE